MIFCSSLSSPCAVRKKRVGWASHVFPFKKVYSVLIIYWPIGIVDMHSVCRIIYLSGVFWSDDLYMVSLGFTSWVMLCAMVLRSGYGLQKSTIPCSIQKLSNTNKFNLIPRLSSQNKVSNIHEKNQQDFQHTSFMVLWKPWFVGPSLPL